MRRLPKSLSVLAFRDAWKNSRDSKSNLASGAPGVDRLSPQAFAAELDRQIAEIREAIRQRTFRFNKLRLAPVLKPSGGHRIIAIPTVRDRLVQRVLRRDLESDKRFRPSSNIAFGFTKGRSLADAQRRALALRSDRPWVLQADIVKFFDQIDRNQVKKLIRKSVRRKSVAELLCAAVDCELEDASGKRQQLVLESEIIRGKGLRQGMPISPMLSNLFLKTFDNKLSARKLVAIRYADDIAVFGNTKQELIAALDLIQSTLTALGLRIPELEAGAKTTLAGPSDVVEFLGVEIRRTGEGYKLAAPAKKLDKIEALMHETVTLDECIKGRRNLGNVVRWLDAFIIGHAASMAVLDDPAAFLARLEAAKQRALNAFLVELLGKSAVNALDGDRRAILGLQRFL